MALSIVADQLNLPIVVPGLVVEEAEAAYERSLQALIEDFEKCSAQVESAFALEYVSTEPTLTTEPQMLRWRRELEQLGEIGVLDPADAVECLRREIRGDPPAAPRRPRRPGVGGRDATIWLSILRDHAARDEPGHYLTADVSNLLDGNAVKPALQADFSEGAHEVSIWRSVAEFLSALGYTEGTLAITPETLTSEALPAIQAGHRDSMVVPLLVFPRAGRDERFQTRIVQGHAERIISAGRYLTEDAEVDLVNAHWRLVAKCAVETPDRDGYWVVDEIRLKAVSRSTFDAPKALEPLLSSSLHSSPRPAPPTYERKAG